MLYTDVKKNEELGTREPIASKILDFATKLGERADALAARANEKLITVMISIKPNPDGIKPKNFHQEYPPLFSGLHNQLQKIESALDSIEDALSRIEL